MAHLVVQEGQRAVVRRDGPVVGVRQRLLVVAGQEISAADVPGVRVSAAARWRVVDPVAHLDLTADPLDELRTAVQLAVRDWLVALPLADALAGRAQASALLTPAVTAETARLGIEVTEVSVRDVGVPAELRRALLQLRTVAAAAQTGGQLVLHLGTRPGGLRVLPP